MAAPTGNIFALGNNGGRPPIYESPEMMWEKAVEYFESTQMPNKKYQPTIEGLTFHLGFSARKSLADYEQRSEEFCYVVGKMKTFIKYCYERQLYGFAWAGASFALKNMGASDWKDEVIQNQNQTVTSVTITEKKRED